jgi:hypothetical protein
MTELCADCPPVCYPTDATRCAPCPRRTSKVVEHAIGPHDASPASAREMGEGSP